MAAPHQQNPPLLSRPSSVSDSDKDDEKSLSSRPPSVALPYPGQDAMMSPGVSRQTMQPSTGSSETGGDYIGGTKDREKCSDIIKEGEDLGPVLSRIVTGRTNIVPRRQRRGLLATLTIIPEIENPLEYTRGTKTVLTLVVSLAGASAPMASAVLFPALGPIAKELHSAPTLANLSVATYMLGMAIFPLWWSSFAERLGYRTIYLISFTFYVICNICAALSINIAMLIVFRTLSGASAASAQTIGAGTIASIYDVKERGAAMGYFYLGPLCGPLLSPIIGGALTERFGWRSTQWFLAAFGVLVLLTMIFCIPETSGSPARNRATIKSDRAEQDVNLEAGGKVLPSTPPQEPERKSVQWLVTTKILLVDPLRSLKFVRYPPVLVTVYWASLAFGLLYMLNVSIQNTFAKPPYNFSVLIIGLLYIPGSLGYVIASILGGRWNDIIMDRAAKARRAANPNVDPNAPLEYCPEDRMGINAWVAGCLFPLALLWYGWMVQKGVLWVGVMFATFSFGIGCMLVFSLATTMLTEFVPQRSASAVAVNNFFRNICSCVGGVVAAPLINAIGNGWVFTILCFVGLISVVSVWIMQKYGPQWREKAMRGEYKHILGE